jgi:hypothetical protein
MSKTPADKSIEEQTFEALEDALKIDLNDDGLGVLDDVSLDELEDKVSSAARELKSAGAAQRPSAQSARPRRAKTLRPRPLPRHSRRQARWRRPTTTAARTPPVCCARSKAVRAAARSATPPCSRCCGPLGVLGLANLLYAPAIWQIRSVSDLLAMPAAIGFLVAIIIPILVFFAFSIMMARAREMRSAARSMAEVALRLAEPENIAGDRILTVGQAVRREVSAMNEGIERTIARASELETLVHSEVNALERSYSDNEMRVRSLVQELGSERDAIVSHAERIRASIAGAHEQLKEELTTASEEIATRISTSGEAFAQLMETRAAALQERTTQTSRELEQLLDGRTEALVTTLKTSGGELTDEFDTRLEMLNVQLNHRGKALLAEFETRASTLDANTEKLNAALGERARQLNETLIARTREISDSLFSGQQAISAGLEETLAALNSSLDEKGSSFSQALKSSADDAIMDLDLRSGFFEEKLESTDRPHHNGLRRACREFTSAFDSRAGSLDTKLSESLSQINETLNGGTSAMDGILSASLERIGATLADRSQALEATLGKPNALRIRSRRSPSVSKPPVQAQPNALKPVRKAWPSGSKHRQAAPPNGSRQRPRALPTGLKPRPQAWRNGSDTERIDHAKPVRTQHLDRRWSPASPTSAAPRSVDERDPQCHRADRHSADRISTPASTSALQALFGGIAERADALDLQTGILRGIQSDRLSAHTLDVSKARSALATLTQRFAEPNATGSTRPSSRAPTGSNERLTTMNNMLGAGLDSVSKTIEGKATGLAAKLREAVANAATELDAEALKAGETLQSVGTGFAGRMDEQARELRPRLDSHVEERTADLAAHAEISPTAFPHGATELSSEASRISDLVERVGETVGNQANAISNTLDASEAGSPIRPRPWLRPLETETGAISNRMDETAETLVSSLDEEDIASTRPRWCRSKADALPSETGENWSPAPAPGRSARSEGRRHRAAAGRRRTGHGRPRHQGSLDPGRAHPRAQFDACKPLRRAVPRHRRTGTPAGRAICLQRRGVRQPADRGHPELDRSPACRKRSPDQRHHQPHQRDTLGDRNRQPEPEQQCRRAS